MIVPRLDLNPAYTFVDKAWSFDLGATSLYTVFDGNLGDYFSFSFANHWFAYQTSFEDVKNLYRNTWRCDDVNWVDWANVSLHLGQFSLTLGKDYIHFGTFETDAYDFDSHAQLNTLFWNNYQVYQWGGSLNWTTPDEDSKVMLQVTTDQLMDRPFSSKSFDDYNITLFGFHDFGGVELMASVSHCSLDWLGALGINVNFTDNLSMTMDSYISKVYGGVNLKLTASLADGRCALFAKGGYEKGNTGLIIEGQGFYGGFGGYWYPLRDSQDLRIHALYSYDGVLNEMVMLAGITYALNLKLF